MAKYLSIVKILGHSQVPKAAYVNQYDFLYTKRNRLFKGKKNCKFDVS